MRSLTAHFCLLIAALGALSQGCVSCESFPEDLPMDQGSPKIDLGPLDLGEDAGAPAPDAGLDLGPGPEDLGPEDAGQDMGPEDLGAPDMGPQDGGEDMGAMVCGDFQKFEGCLTDSMEVMSTAGGAPPSCPQGDSRMIFCEDFSDGLAGWCNGQSLWRRAQDDRFTVNGGVVLGAVNGGIHIPLPRFCGGFELEASLRLSRGASLGGPSPEWTALGIMLLSSRYAEEPGPFIPGATCCNSLSDSVLEGYYLRIHDYLEPGGTLSGPFEVYRFSAQTSTAGAPIGHNEELVFDVSERWEEAVPQVADPFEIELRVRFDPQDIQRPWSVFYGGAELSWRNGYDGAPYTGPFDYLSVKTYRSNTMTSTPAAWVDQIQIRRYP